MELQVNKDSVVAGSTDINTRNLQTNVVVDNGQTVILGGVYEQTKTKSVDKVPFFGDLPILGYAFRQTQNVENNSELLIFVTPQIIKESVTKN
jgi:type IV pilus assembly protein PilQ